MCAWLQQTLGCKEDSPELEEIYDYFVTHLSATTMLQVRVMKRFELGALERALEKILKRIDGFEELQKKRLMDALAQIRGDSCTLY